MSSDEEVSPRKRARVAMKKRRDDEEEEPSSSSKSRSRPSAKATSPERKRKGGKSKEKLPTRASMGAQREENDDDEEASDVPTDNAEDEEGSASRENSNADENENARYRLENDGDEDAFEIPTRDDDLLSRLKVGYRITEVVDEDAATAAVDEFEDEIGQDRWRCLYERFPAFFSLLRSPSDGPRYATSPALRNRLADLLCLTYSKISFHLKRVLSKAASGPRTTKIDAHCRDLSDHLLMLTYLLHKLICIAEEEARTTKKKPAKKAKKPRKGKGAVVQNEEGDMSGGDDDGMGGNVEAEEENTWEETRGKVLECLAEMANVSTQDTDGKTVESAMRFLWKNNINKSFRNTITDCALQFLRNPDITRPPARNALTLVFKLFRAICINFRQFTYTGSVLFITLTNLDYYKESGATAYPFIERIKAVGVNKDMNKLMEQMLDYFTNGQTNVSPSNAKPLCLFMSTIAEAEPYMTFQHIMPFLQLLKDDNASIRSTVLNVITVLLTQDFLDPSKVLLSERFSIARNRMYDHLLQHVRDVNANVRASALKCLTSMAKAQRIPRDLIQEGLVRLVSHRISDDKVAVRKEAIRFATIFLMNNPYGHDFDRKTNEKKLKDCLLKRDGIRMDGADMKSIQEAERVWNRSKDDLQKEVLQQCEAELIEEYEIPTVDQRKQMYREFMWRQTQKDHGGAADEEEQEEPTERDVTMRWLMTLLISEEVEKETAALYKAQIQSVARLLVGMGETDQLKNEQCTKDDLNKCTSSDQKTRLLMKAGRFAFIHTAAMIMGRNEQMILEKEMEMERQKKIRKALSKDIQDMVMKLVFEREYAECLKAGMTAVLQGEGGDLKLGIEFVIKCKEFNITGAEEQVRKLCGLVWKSDEEGRQQILQAASSMFLSSNADPLTRDASTAANILNLVKAMSDHERGSVEQVLALTTKFNPMPGGVYHLLWKQVDEDSIAKGTGKKHTQVTAMKALCLLSRSDVARNRQWLRRYQKIVQDGWPEIAAEALGCIANLATWHTKDDGNLPETRAYRIPGSDSLFKTVQRFMLTELCREEARTWNRSLRATLDIYFHICKDTQDVVAGLVSKLMWFLRRTSQALRYYDQQQNQNGAMTPRSQRNEPTVDPILKGVVVDERSKYLNRLWSVLLERLCVLASEVAVRLLVHADYVFVREFIKARQYISSQTEGAPFPRRKLFAWEENSVLRRGIFDWGSDNADDVECTGLTEDERIREMARKMIDTQLVDHPQALLYRLLPIVVHAVRAKGSPRRVRFQAMNALSKIMLVSPRVAQQGARTFFAFLNNAESPVLRSNLTVVAADLTFRHPNLVENHAAALFNQLQDPDPCVRETCVLILNHLISNDLIKTHVIMAYALLGYVDTTKSIVQLTKNLFHEWSKKEGIMNHVPSFITRIAADSQKVSLEKFKRIMDEFFPLIRERKDADVQALVIKLCKRIELAKNPACIVRNPDMPAYFSYCLRQLTLNSRGFHKLVDCFDQYSQYLADRRVFEDINALVVSFRESEKKNQNTDLNAEIQVFIAKMAEANELKGAENRADVDHQNEREKAERARVAASGAVSQSATARKMRAHKAISSGSATPARAGRPKKAKRRNRYMDSESEEEYSD